MSVEATPLTPVVSLIVFKQGQLILKECAPDYQVPEWRGLWQIPETEIRSSDDLSYTAAISRIRRQELSGIRLAQYHRSNTSPLFSAGTTAGLYNSVQFFGELAGREDVQNLYFDVDNLPADIIPGQDYLIREAAYDFMCNGLQHPRNPHHKPQIVT